MEKIITYNRPNHTKSSEEELVECAKNDPREFEPLYDKYFKQVFLFVLHRVGKREEAKDITSGVFLRALSNIHKYEFRGLPFSSWLYRIAINQCNEHFRKSGSKQHILLDDINFFCLTEEMNLFEEENRSFLYRALQKLKPAEITIIELRFFESLPFREVGDVLGITDNNAKVRVYRTLEKLRKLIERKK